MFKYVIRESAPEYIDFDFEEYFDYYTVTGEEDFNKTVFIVPTRHHKGFNGEKWEEIVEQADGIAGGFSEVGGKYATWDSYKECMEDFGVPYTPHKCHLLKEWVKSAELYRAEDVAAFLSITTGKKWEVRSARGYCQGDYAEIVFCVEEYTDKEIDIFGDYYFGCFKEFCVIELDEYGDEVETIWGYYVTDSEAWKDEEYKKAVCNMADIEEDEARLEMIDGSSTYTSFTYRVA